MRSVQFIKFRAHTADVEEFSDLYIINHNPPWKRRISIGYTLTP